MHSRVVPLRASAAISLALRAPVVQRTAHFALHVHAGDPHLAMPARGASSGASGAVQRDLSTDAAKISEQPVDNTATAWLACVVPKRHAKRAVTRNLIKRQIRSTSREWSERVPVGLAAGAYVVRLNRPFQPALFHSAASERLRAQVRTELCGLWQRVLARQQQPVAGAHAPPPAV